MVTNSIEIGNYVHELVLSANGQSFTYRLKIGYSFNYAEKEGLIDSVEIFKPHFGEAIKVDGTGEDLQYEGGKYILSDFQGESSQQGDDLVEELLLYVQDFAQENNLIFFDSHNSREEYFENQ